VRANSSEVTCFTLPPPTGIFECIVKELANQSGVSYVICEVSGVLDQGKVLV